MSSRSLSPHREIAQMTPQKQAETHRDAGAHSGAHAKSEEFLHQEEYDKNEIGENTAYLLQCGSPLYDPVRESWRCWGGHELRVKERAQYGTADGISCDFCGFTDWREEVQGEEESLKPKRRGRKRIHRKETHEGTQCFYHCDLCLMDLCTHCANELRDDRRYHVPCMQCRRCLVFMRSEEAALHLCHLKRTREAAPIFTTPSISTSGGASSSPFAESVATLTSARAREPSPPVVPEVPNLTVFSVQRCETAWEVCVTFEAAEAEAEVRRIGESLSAREVETPGMKGQLIFRTRTRLAAEELVHRIHDRGLFASLRRFRA